MLSVFVIVMSLRARTWDRLMLKTNVDGTVDSAPVEDQIKTGDQGTTITRLAPMGKVQVNNIVREAKSIEGFIDEHSDIEVVSVEGTRVSVKPVIDK
jgi:membrane-bound ClpP family serine protease